MSLLDNINSPRDLDGMTLPELESLSAELRECIISTVSANGGHLSSNLGLVETTVALHRVFDSPHDNILFDVGHQAYAHKLLTGRRDQFDTLRTLGGLSGFVKRGESEHDKLSAGHSGTSLSAAVGMATAAALEGSDAWTVALIGDGSFTNGMIYEALNNCCGSALRLIVILNDNEMSISPNVGAISRYFSRIAVSSHYFSFKHGLKRFFSHVPLVGESLVQMTRAIKNFIKRVLISGNFFEDFGLDYLGPVDGNNLKQLISVLNEAKTKETPCLVHLRTQKGRGYVDAEAHPDLYHSTSPFNRDVGIASVQKSDFSAAFGEALCHEAALDGRICAITAAMASGTGLCEFAHRYPLRFFDVGIAEEHAVTFAGGLAAGGMLPVFAVYSTFAQRVCDQLLHDISLQKLPLVLALDRCGFVDGDGITHQGIFDIPLFACIPGIEIWSPAYKAEITPMLRHALRRNALTVLRYPRGDEPVFEINSADFISGDEISWLDIGEAHGCTLITYGRLTATALEAARLAGGARVISLKRVIPLPLSELKELLEQMNLVCIFEECEQSGGIGERIVAALAPSMSCTEFVIRAVDNSFGGQGRAAELFEQFKMTPADIAELIRR